MNIRPARAADAESIWEIFQEVIAGGDTYVFDETTTRAQAIDYWMGEEVECYVAEIDGRVVGMHLLRPNRPGRGAHIGNASFAVSAGARGKGVGEALGRHALERAKARGFTGMQFNFVVSTNERAVALWKKLGFNVIATVPGGFAHATRGYVDVYIMHQAF